MTTSQLSEDYLRMVDILTELVMDATLNLSPSRGDSPFTPEIAHAMRNEMMHILRSGGSKDEIRASLRQLRTEQERQVDELFDNVNRLSV